MRYFDDWGIPAAERGRHGADYVLPSNQTIRLRSAADPTLPPAVEGGSTAREVVWGVEDAASLDAIGTELSKDRRVDTPDLRTQDPWGMSIAFRVADPRALPAHEERRRNVVFELPPRAQPSRIGHVVFFVPASKIGATADFYIDRLGFRLSDRVPGFGDFMRASGSLEHHNLFLLAQGERAGFNHAAFEVTNVDEIVVGGKFMEKKGWKAATSLGRHVMGSNVFWYFENPSGGNTEYFTDMDLLDDDWKPRVWEKHPGFAYWMMEELATPAKSDPGRSLLGASHTATPR